jgi:hypothetical protein
VTEFTSKGRNTSLAKYPKQIDGEWVRPIESGFKECFCDCGLVHKVDFRIVEGHVEYRVFRDNRATGQVRRFLKKRIVNDDRD